MKHTIRNISSRPHYTALRAARDPLPAHNKAWQEREEYPTSNPFPEHPELLHSFPSFPEASDDLHTGSRSGEATANGCKFFKNDSGETKSPGLAIKSTRNSLHIYRERAFKN